MEEIKKGLPGGSANLRTEMFMKLKRNQFQFKIPIRQTGPRLDKPTEHLTQNVSRQPIPENSLPYKTLLRMPL